MPGRRALSSLILLAIVSGAGTGAAAPIAITNAGFEDLYLGSNLPAQYGGDVPAGAFPTGPPPAGWSAIYTGPGGLPAGGEFLGVLNPGTSADYGAGMPCFPAGAPEGDNMALLFTSGDTGGPAYGVGQVLTVDLAPSTTYTLSVDVGNIQSCAGLVAPYLNFFVLEGFPGYRVQLLAGGTLLAEDPGLLSPGEGLVERSTVVFTTGPTVAPGQALEIRLLNENDPDVGGVDGLEVDFDNVTLDASPAVPVPMSGALAIAALTFALATGGALRLRGRRT